MSTATANLALKKAVDADNAKTYLETDLGGSQDILDALFHITTGHLHTGAGTNGPKIATAALAAGAATQRSFARGTTSAPTTTSAGLANLPDPQIVFVATGGDVVVLFAGQFSNATAAAVHVFSLAMSPLSNDGAVQQSQGVASMILPVVMLGYWPALAAGTYTIIPQWSTTAGTLTGATVQRALLALELKR